MSTQDKPGAGGRQILPFASDLLNQLVAAVAHLVTGGDPRPPAPANQVEAPPHH